MSSIKHIKNWFQSLIVWIWLNDWHLASFKGICTLINWSHRSNRCYKIYISDPSIRITDWAEVRFPSYSQLAACPSPCHGNAAKLVFLKHSIAAHRSGHGQFSACKMLKYITPANLPVGEHLSPGCATRATSLAMSNAFEVWSWWNCPST